MQLIAESVYGNICLAFSLFRIVCNKEMLYHYCFPTCLWNTPLVGFRQPGGLETAGYTLAFR